MRGMMRGWRGMQRTRGAWNDAGLPAVCATLSAAAYLEFVLVPINLSLSTSIKVGSDVSAGGDVAPTKKSMPDVCTGFIFGTENEAGQPLLTPHYQDRKNHKCCLRCVLVSMLASHLDSLSLATEVLTRHLSRFLAALTH